MDLVAELAKELRDLEYARASSPSGPDEQSPEWAEMRIRALLPTVVERLTSPAAIEEAEPHLETAFDAGFRDGRGQHDVDLRPGKVTRELILAACKAAGVDERPPEHSPPADPVFDALATAMLRCGFEAHEFVCLAAGEREASKWVGLIVHPEDGDAYFHLRTKDFMARRGLEGAEQIVLETCEALDVDYVGPTELELAALRRWTATLAA